LTGRFRHVDLDRVVTDHFDHKLSGNAEVVFTRARFQDGKLVEAAGDLKCEGGVISRSLLVQAGKSLGLVADPRVNAIQADTYCRFQTLRFGFQINTGGLKLVGLCHSVGEGVVLADEFGTLLSDQPQEIAQVVALVRTLASRHGEQVPASPEAYQLLHVLPIPSRTEQSPEMATPTPAYSPLRLQ
jgi:hypothetical protein